MFNTNSKGVPIMDHEFSHIAAVLEAIVDNHNTERVVPVFTAGGSWVEVDSIFWMSLVHEAKIARARLDMIRVAYNEAQQLQLF